ncbi:Glycosyltransferase involved in cell wall bisynthesis [Singulisphaera sp. GP187]|uniref:glycosyltransferase family 2 protein n=1 Tax=Singulisphaera sp. GP187 TaxID=1882752 RepID=UPI000925CBB0|nr:glycosyltransferase family 2 protein [Singulisphaera sp. GP187]SIN89394.1 Glycosyltransferase involved in cell wall bisynthesis [Singulisphaera sp. GP187]
MISFVVPVHNEGESLVTLHEELSRVVDSQALGDVEFLFIDDGSGDDTWDVILKLAGADPRVHAIRFRRNFGKAAALTAGFESALGEIVFTLDGDLQDDPAEIPRFLEKLDQGLDVVSGWKRRRYDPWHKVGPSRIFNAMVSSLTGCRLHDHNCGFKVYRRQVLAEVGIYGELHRFVPVLAHARGFRVGEIEVHHRPRQFGSSKYGVTRMLKGLLDLLTVRFLTRFSQRPLHVLGGMGMVLLLLGGIGLVYLAFVWLIGDGPIGHRPLLVYASTLVGVGSQFFCLGILAELVTSYSIRAEDTFSISDRISPRTGPSAEKTEGPR